MSQMSPCQTSRFGFRQVRSTFWISASNQSSSLAKSSSAVQPSGSNPADPGRKSTARLRPTLARSRSWISGSGSLGGILRVELGQRELGGAQAQPPGQLAADDLRHQRQRPLAGAAELQHVGAEVVGLDDRGQAAALAERGEVAGHPDVFKHAGQRTAIG